jgi:hypothetical protein
MSFDVSVQCFERGEFGTFTREQLRAAFGDHLREVEPDFWQLHYGPQDSCDLYLSSHNADPTLLDHLTLNRPCHDARLWDALAGILTLGNLVLYFPGEHPPLVTNHRVSEHLSADMIAVLGQPVVIASGAEIQRAVQAA